VVAASLAGSLRRGRETTKDIDLLVAAEDGGPAIERFLAATDVDEVIGRGETKVSVRLLDGLNADLRVVPPASWGAALQYFTGSKAHNIALRSRARERGLTINEYGVYPLEAPPGTAPVASRTEAEVYGAVGLPYIEPELREDQGELAAAEAGELPRLIEAVDIQGDLHCHSRWSDGRQTIVEMARAARARGYQYLGICDHSKSLTVANGLDERRVREQWVEIAQAQDEVPEVRLLRGIEVDILSDGTLDLPVDLLAELDVVVASVHSAFSQDTERMTARLLAALETGVVDILGHPTGRRIGRREGFTFDLGAVFAVAAERGVAMEINASPERLDLDDLSARRARRQGAWISINTDAHHIDHLDFVRYGIAQARRAWLTRDDVVNTRSLDELLLWLKD
ncbi:MAG: PHP domain-containing protein, partial [Armatimonadetes bacterium]|nr:PHP domain-containing protein [Armatimonadota bacterium]